MSAVVLAGCAGYTIQKDGTGAGYDVYGSHPYLVATQVTDERGKQTATFAVTYLPDYSRRYRVSSSAGLGKSEFTFEFENGWMLKKITDKADNTAVPAAITSLVGLAKTTLGGPAPAAARRVEPEAPPFEEPEREPPAPILYRIEFDDCGKIAGLTRIHTADLGHEDPRRRGLMPCCPTR